MARPSALSRVIQFVLSCIRCIHHFVQSHWERWTSATIALDSGRTVRIGQKLAEGGFSIVFQARDTQTNKLYALKRIQCPEKEQLRECLREAGVHRSLDHPNLMPLLGFGESGGPQHHDHCYYMLFPYCSHSLRDEVNSRSLLHMSSADVSPPKPWKEVHALQLFWKVCRGVQAMHQLKYTHRDIKLENILFMDFHQPVLMDFGSVGPLSQSVSDRRQVMNVIEDAAQHTTMPYRPPELFEGGVRAGDPDIDYQKVDVWSLGCTLFAMLYGASPLEAEFVSTHGSRDAAGRLRVVECSQLKVIGPVPRPPAGSPVAQWYSASTQQLIELMLTQDRMVRPELAHVIERVEQTIRELGGSVEMPIASRRMTHYHDDVDDDGIALLSTNRLV